MVTSTRLVLLGLGLATLAPATGRAQAPERFGTVDFPNSCAPAVQEAFLRSHGCDEMQGFLISKPVPARQMAELLRPMDLPGAPPLQPEPDHAASEAAVLRLKSAVV
jgi:hypothetical protein